jgi:class 3 adenylate cyclase
VLFLDIVGSTSVASEMGDARWRDLLSRFRDVVRGRLKAEGGREESFTGDGFLGHIRPSPRTRCALPRGSSRTSVRSGSRSAPACTTGEIETIDGHVGGSGSTRAPA